MKDFSAIQRELAQPFAPDDLEWRLQVTNKEQMRGMAVPFVTSRAIQDRLDNVLGAQNWRNEFQVWQESGDARAQLCGLSIYLEERKEWVTKWDGAENTDIESVKGGLSDAMKRAAVQWGIGRILYWLSPVWVNVEPRGKSFVIQKNEYGRLCNAYMDALRNMGLTPAQPGALQSQRIPNANAAPVSQNVTRSAPPSAQDAQTSQNTTSTAGQNVPPAQNAPKVDYFVLAAQEQKGMTRTTTKLTLRKLSDGSNTDAFFNGVDPKLTAGARLCNVTLKQRQQNGVNYLTLESYAIVPQERAAA